MNNHELNRRKCLILKDMVKDIEYAILYSSRDIWYKLRVANSIQMDKVETFEQLKDAIEDSFWRLQKVSNKEPIHFASGIHFSLKERE